jgi:hypothetical protein
MDDGVYAADGDGESKGPRSTMYASRRGIIRVGQSASARYRCAAVS